MPAITHRDLAAPTSRAKPFNDPDWVWELKHDGYRALLIKDGPRTSLLTRRGNELLGHFPEIAAELSKLPNLVIDGELVMLNAEGKPEFHQLRGRCAIRDPKRLGIAAASNRAEAVTAYQAHCLLPARRGERRAVIPGSGPIGFRGVIGKKANSRYPRE